MKTMNMIPFATIAFVLVAMMVISAVPWQTILGFVYLIAALAVFLALYFAPSVLARQRKLDRGAGLLFGINLFLGWTVLFWLFCLLWAVVGQTRDQAEYYRTRRGHP